MEHLAVGFVWSSEDQYNFGTLLSTIPLMTGVFVERFDVTS